MVHQMNKWKLSTLLAVGASIGIVALSGVPARAQLPDATQATSTINFGIRKSVTQEIGGGRSLRQLRALPCQPARVRGRRWEQHQPAGHAKRAAPVRGRNKRTAG